MSLFDQVVDMTAAVEATGFVQEYFSAISHGSSHMAETIFEGFRSNNPNLYKEIIVLGDTVLQVAKSSNRKQLQIFGTETSYNAEQIDPLSFFFLTLFGKFRESYLFTIEDFIRDDPQSFLGGLSHSGYKYLSNFISMYNWEDFVGEYQEYKDIHRLMVAILHGKFDD